MAKSYASTVIGASPDEVWAHVRDFNGLATWHSGLVSQSEIEDGKAATRSAPSAASRSPTERTFASSSSSTPISSARTHTTSRRRRSTSTTTARRSV